jgi:hypothetical protein
VQCVGTRAAGLNANVADYCGVHVLLRKHLQGPWYSSHDDELNMVHIENEIAMVYPYMEKISSSIQTACNELLPGVTALQRPVRPAALIAVVVNQADTITGSDSTLDGWRRTAELAKRSEWIVIESHRHLHQLCLLSAQRSHRVHFVVAPISSFAMLSWFSTATLEPHITPALYAVASQEPLKFGDVLLQQNSSSKQAHFVAKWCVVSMRGSGVRYCARVCFPPIIRAFSLAAAASYGVQFDAETVYDQACVRPRLMQRQSVESDSHTSTSMLVGLAGITSQSGGAHANARLATVMRLTQQLRHKYLSKTIGDVPIAALSDEQFRELIKPVLQRLSTSSWCSSPEMRAEFVKAVNDSIGSLAYVKVVVSAGLDEILLRSSDHQTAVLGSSVSRREYLAATKGHCCFTLVESAAEADFAVNIPKAVYVLETGVPVTDTVVNADGSSLDDLMFAMSPLVVGHWVAVILRGTSVIRSPNGKVIRHYCLILIIWCWFWGISVCQPIVQQFLFWITQYLCCRSARLQHSRLERMRANATASDNDDTDNDDDVLQMTEEDVNYEMAVAFDEMAEAISNGMY